jgi:hypothetical protein
MSKIGNRKDNYVPNDVIFTDPFLFEQLGVVFDVDVCSPKIKPDWIPAKKHYWLELNGLEQHWVGNVWCNPPYSEPKPWVDKFIAHKFGIMLVPFSKSNWFIKLWNTAEGIALVDHTKYKFIDTTMKTKNIFSPVALFAFGQTNINAIQKIGKVR